MGQIWVLREFLPAMVKMDRGSIIFMCGLPGHAGAPNMSVTKNICESKLKCKC